MLVDALITGISIQANTVVIDPGFPFIHIPKKDFDDIYNQLKPFLRTKGITIDATIKDRLKIS